MPGTFDAILNVIIPIAVFVVFGFVFYKGFKDPIDRLVNWIREMIASARERSAMNQEDAAWKRSSYAIGGGELSYRY